ncbi:MAG: GHKL domain-containing protein [Clostridia bacterium]|nr:GHKL domain-containing protein [Clostridia bacterium]
MNSIALNIILQLIEALILISFYEGIQKAKFRIKDPIYIVTGYMIMCAVNLIFNYNVIINIIIMLIFHFFFAKVLYKQKTSFSIFYSVLIACLVMLTEFMVISILNSINGETMRYFIENTYTYILLIVFSKSLLFVLLKIVSEIVNKSQYNGKTNFTFLIFPLSLLLIMIDFVVVCSYYKLPNNVLLILACSSLFLIIAVIITCILQQKQDKKEQELFELKAYQQEQETNNTYFELLEHQNDELQLFVHDTKKHYRALYDLSNEPEKLQKYIEGIVDDLEKTNQIGKTSNKLLDLILSKYDYICEKNHITFEKNIHKSDVSFMADNDLTSILNNMLDNAFESAVKSNRKIIIMGINKLGNMLVFDITNSSDTPPLVKNGKLISTKKSVGLHGYGFKSICRTAKKYNGDVEWEYNQNAKEFTVSIIFPIEN